MNSAIKNPHITAPSPFQGNFSAAKEPHENSPAFQRWVYPDKFLIPAGTVEINIINSILFSRPFRAHLMFYDRPGVETPGYYQVALRDKKQRGEL